MSILEMLAPSSTLIPHCSSHLCWDRDLSLTPALSLPPCWKSSLRDKKGAHFKEHPILTSPHAPASDKRNGERKHEHDETKPRASEEVDTVSYLPLTGPSELRPARVRACAPHPAWTATPLTSSVPFLHKASQPTSTHVAGLILRFHCSSVYISSPPRCKALGGLKAIPGRSEMHWSWD